MKRLFSMLLVVVLAIGLSAPVFADVIWEPIGDSYYDKNRDRFTYDSSTCYANSPAGEVVGFSKPDGKELIRVPNGTLLYSTYLCTDKSGKEWALCSMRIQDQWESVYFPLNDLLDRYDEEFLSDHEDEIRQEAPENLSLTFEEEKLLLWTYPQGVPAQVENRWQEMDFVPACRYFYTDQQGNLWGYIGYWMGHIDQWVCLSDINNPDLAEPEIYTGTLYPAGVVTPTEGTEPAPAKESFIRPAVVLPLAVILLTAALLLFWPKKKKDGEEP